MTSTTIYPTMAEPGSIQSMIREKLADKLKTGFVELIPQEMFNAMVDSAVDEFVNGPRSKRFRWRERYLSADDPFNTTGKAGSFQYEEPYRDEKYNVVADPATLPGMIYLELVGLGKAAIAKAVAEDERFQQKFDHDINSMVMPALNEIIKDNAPAFMQALINNIVQYTMGAAINNMRSGAGMGNYIPPAPKF